MAAKSPPKHYYMVSALITYVRPDAPDVPKQRYLNAVTELPRKAITASAINQTRLALFQRLADESGVTTEWVRDITFFNFCYLGALAPEDFYDMEQPAAGTPKH